MADRVWQRRRADGAGSASPEGSCAEHPGMQGRCQEQKAVGGKFLDAVGTNAQLIFAGYWRLVLDHAGEKGAEESRDDGRIALQSGTEDNFLAIGSRGIDRARAHEESVARAAVGRIGNSQGRLHDIRQSLEGRRIVEEAGDLLRVTVHAELRGR